jgi:predicted aldo/keto reductase-like oxidoreductase
VRTDSKRCGGRSRPQVSSIPRCFAVYNDACMFPDTDTARTVYNLWMPKESRASVCTECGRCVKLCPQQIPIPERLKGVDRQLARG